ncbi:MAG: nucleotidyltransferase family protein [Pseudomonadota bacterium]
MIDWRDCGLIILASGRSQRFGDGDKLTAPFRGKPLAEYAAQLANAAPFAKSIAIIAPERPELKRLFSSYNITTLVNDDPGAGQGRSLALGVSAIAELGCKAAIITLADMPFIKHSHLDRLRIEVGENESAIAFDGQRRSPPVLFRNSMFEKLSGLTGDAGAREILRQTRRVKNVMVPTEDLIDIDTREDLTRYDITTDE